MFNDLRNPLEETLTLQHLKAVLDAQEGQNASFFAPLHSSKEWTQINERIYYVIKAETHCHPSAISPFPGAATGVSHLFQPFVPLFVVFARLEPFFLLLRHIS